MAKEHVTCCNCGHTFEVGIPNERVMTSYGSRSIFSSWSIDFSCPKCSKWMGANLGSKKN